MADDHSISQLIGKLKEGDAAAAQHIWERYFDKLVRVAFKKLRGTPRRMADEEDVALSAFKSFCQAAQRGAFPRLEDRDDLWQLLVLLASRKAADLAHFQVRQKRGGGAVRGESAFLRAGDEGAGLDQFLGREPTPQFAAQVAEELQMFLDRLADPTLRHIALAKLEGHTHEEIAAQLGVSDETIRRKLKRIQRTLSQLVESE